jgi:uncharacterized RDD family membrane protein YckC
MSQGYGPQDPNRPDYGQQPPQQPYGSQPPPYGTPVPAGYGQPAPGAGAGWGGDTPGYYMGRALGNWPQRVGAYLVDSLIAGIPVFLAVILFTPEAGEPASGAGALVVFLLYLVSLGITVYNRWILGGRTGQSWGKQVFNLRLLRMSDGQPIGAGMAFVRDLAHIIDALPCYIGFLFPLWDNRRQTLADKIMSTVVIAER